MFGLDIVPLSLPIISGMLLIFFMRLLDVSLGTLRMMLVMRGLKVRAALLGFVEVTIWVLAVSQVIGNLGNLWNVLAYSSGFAMGTLVGIWLESKLALGLVDIHIISTSQGKVVAAALRQADFGVTELQGIGRSGNVDVISTVVKRRDATKIIKLATDIDAKSFITMDDVKEIRRGYLQVRK